MRASTVRLWRCSQESSNASRVFSPGELSTMPLREILEQMDSSTMRSRDACQTLIRRCGAERALQEGQMIHKFIREHGMDRSRFITNHIVSMYGQCGSIDLAQRVFEQTPDKNVYSWAMIISACIQNGDGRRAIQLYRQMQLGGCIPDAHVVSSAFSAVAITGQLSAGKAIYASIADSPFLTDPVIGNSILNMFRKCGSAEEFEHEFWRSPFKDEFSWSIMIAARVQGGRESSAIQLLRYMDQEGEKITSGLTFASLVDACGNLAAVSVGIYLHQRILHEGIEVDVVLQTALVNMYAKCGRIEEARKVFEQVQSTDNITSSSMIAAYARNGHFDEALKLFWRMEQDGRRGDSVTFTHVLYACSHGGHVEQAWHYFTSMKQDRGLEIVAEHYGCVVDLLARAGWLAEAEQFLNRMPIAPDAVSWMSLLQACRIHRNADIGARAAEQVYKLAPRRAGPYSLLSNIYSAIGRHDLADKVQKLMRERGVKKPGGRSRIEIGGKVHEFIVGDSWHPELPEICKEIQRLSKVMKEHGYVPDTKQVLHDAEEDEKEDILYFHSEKLAMGLGLIKTRPGTTIKVVKNIRVCPDCHTFAKLISKVTERKIVIRDLNLFHHLDDGVCSCRDYW